MARELNSILTPDTEAIDAKISAPITFLSLTDIMTILSTRAISQTRRER